jgi:hypothetical protein
MTKKSQSLLKQCFGRLFSFIPLPKKTSKGWIMDKRNKTGIKYNVRLLDIPKFIIAKYAGKQGNDKLLSVISNQNMNEYLHEIAEVCNIKKKITCHCGRYKKTFNYMFFSVLQS